MRATGLCELLDGDNTIGDEGYIGTGIITLYRKPVGGELLDWQKEFNTEINKICYVIERAISHFKTWRCMHADYRRLKRTYATALNAVRALHFFKLRLHNALWYHHFESFTHARSSGKCSTSR
jgi:hypothetical protein